MFGVFLRVILRCLILIIQISVTDMTGVKRINMNKRCRGKIMDLFLSAIIKLYHVFMVIIVELIRRFISYLDYFLLNKFNFMIKIVPLLISLLTSIDPP